MIRRPRRWLLWGWIAICAGCAESTPPFRGIVFPESPPAPNFTLHDFNGDRFQLDEQRGKVVVLFFGFIHCPDICPTTLSTWSEVERSLGDRADSVRFVFVTVDPDRDDPPNLRRHLAIFSRNILGLVDHRELMEALFRDYGILHEKVEISGSASGYLVDHTSRIIVIDPQGRWRLNHEFDVSADDLRHDLLALLDGR